MTESAAGLDLDAACPSLAVGQAGHPSPRGARGIPPALVVSSSRQIPPTLDRDLPIRVEGSGVRDGEDPTRLRIPLAYAWELLQHSATAEVLANATTPYRQGLRAADLVARAAATLFADEGCRHAFCALVVPNSLQEQAQDRLLSETRRLLLRAGSRARLELVWRPIAAALRWLQDHARSIAIDGQPDRESLGSLLHVHLGVDALEVTRLDILPFTEGGTRWLLPGRRLPDPSDCLVGAPMHALEQLVHERARSEVAGEGPAFRFAWNALWAATTLDKIASLSAPGPTELPPWIPEPFAFGIRADLGRRLLQGQVSSRRWLAELQDRPSHARATRDWLEHTAALGKTPLLGAVVTGPLVGIPSGTGRSLGLELAHRVGVPPSHLLLEAGLGRSLLADGAAIYAERRVHGQPTHLDTLPRVTTIVNSRGDPIWKDLLQHDHTWVLGGRTWSHTLDNEFAIARGESDLQLTVHREGAQHCRAVGVDFGRQLDRDTPVTLSIELEPGQGHPRVEVGARERGALGGRTLFLDWSTAPEVGTPDEELERVPRLCPPSEPRLASRDRWTKREFYSLDLDGALGVRSLVLDYLRKPDSWNVSGPKTVDYLNSCLKETRLDATDRLCSSVSSDGEVEGPDGDADLLRRFLDAIDERLTTPDDAMQRECFKILGSCSASTPNLMRRLREFLHGGSHPERFKRMAMLWACGNCLREPDDLRQFFEFFGRADLEYPEAQAMAHLLMYRQDALEHVESRHVEAWLRKLLPLLGSEPATRRMDVTQNRAAVALAYLLRRRCYDPGFLAPGSELHAQARQTVESVRPPERKGETAGVKKTRAELNKILDYLDRKGRGRLTPLMAEEESGT